MSIEYCQYLTKETADIADLDSATRLQYLRRDIYVPHKQAEFVLNELERLFEEPDVIRPQGRQLIANSLMGKTTLIDRFCMEHPASDQLEGDHVHVPVLSIEHPDNPRNQIYNSILSGLGVSLRSRPSPHELSSTAISIMKKVGIRMLIIDEFHSALHGSAGTQRASMDTVKYIMNNLRRPIVLVGTSEVASATAYDTQIKSRFKPIPLNRFNYIRDPESFEDLLTGFQALLPLRKYSELSAQAPAGLIMKLTDGVVGEVRDLLVRAATLAIMENTEQITLDILNRCGASPLSKSPADIISQL